MGLAVEVCGLKLRNPVISGAGPLGRNAVTIMKAAGGGAAAAVTQTVRVRPYQAPRGFIARVRDSLISASRWSEIPADVWVREELRKAKAAGIPVIVSVGGSEEEASEIARAAVHAGADAVEISARHSGSNPGKVAGVVEAVRKAVSVPVFVKVGLPDPVGTARAAESAGADGIVCMDAVGPVLGVDAESGMPLLGTAGGEGLLSGPAVKPLVTYWLIRVVKSVSIPVIGSGGVSSGRDALELIQAGASAVQVCTAAVLRGPKVFGLIADEIFTFMKSRSYGSVNDIRGNLLRRLPEGPVAPKTPEVIPSKCNSCGLCEQQCPTSAIRLFGKGVKIDAARCDGCGLCVTACPVRAIKW